MGFILYTIIAIIAILGGLYQHLIKLLFFSESFVNDFKQSDLSSCLTFPEIKGCEDISIHYPSKLAFIGCPEDHLLNKHLIKTGYNPRNKIPFNKNSFVYLYDIKSKTPKKLNIIGFPADSTFSVHGIDSISDEKDPKLVHFFAVNHRLNHTDAIEHFTYKIGSDDLIHKESFTGEEFFHINSVAAVSPSSFYFTQDAKTPSGIMCFLETSGAISAGSIYYRNAEGEVSSVASGLKIANGLALSATKDKLYLSETWGAKINVYLRDSESGELDLDSIVELGFLPDNLKVDPNSGKVYVAGFPKSFEIFEYFRDYNTPNIKPIHAVAARISNETGENIFYGKKYKYENLLMDNAGSISILTVVAGLEEEGRLLLSGLLTQKGFLDCPIDLKKDY